MSKRYWKAIILLPLLCASQGVTAKGKDAAHDITVEAAPLTVGHWSARVAESLDRGLSYPHPMGIEDYHRGLSKIAFRCSEAGVPSDVVVVHSSGSRDLDEAAMRAVRKISTLHPLPEGIGHDHSFQAWIVFASDEADQARMLRTVRRNAELANAAAQDPTGRQMAADTPTIIVAAP